MSVVVWDGKTLAADRQGVNCDMRFTELKIAVIRRHNWTEIVAWTGNAAFGKELCDWYARGADKEDWPEFQKDKDDWTRLIVANKDGCKFYERSPYPFIVHDPYQAWGSGRDFAMGALAMGADARRAVEVACQHSIGCGQGVEAYDL